MEPIRVLIVDDSVVMRRLLSNALIVDPDILVVGTAFNGKFALKKIEQLNPDIVTLDVEMPEMDGITTITEIRKIKPNLPVIMCSSLTRIGGVITLEALSRGADDYISKPDNCQDAYQTMETLTRELVPRIKAIVQKRRKIPDYSKSTSDIIVPNLGHRSTNKLEVVVIGTSTGGPNALTEVIPKLPENFPVPIVIVQHMPPLFTKLLADRLASKSKLKVVEAADNDELKAGTVWIAPGNFHLEIIRMGLKPVLRLNQNSPENSCRPAVDVLFRSATHVYGKSTLGVVMTGMGQDGLLGSKMIVESGGTIIVQDENTSVVWGMPGCVVQAGLTQEILPLSRISNALIDQVFANTHRRSSS